MVSLAAFYNLSRKKDYIKLFVNLVLKKKSMKKQAAVWVVSVLVLQKINNSFQHSSGGKIAPYLHTVGINTKERICKMESFTM